MTKSGFLKDIAIQAWPSKPTVKVQVLSTPESVILLAPKIHTNALPIELKSFGQRLSKLL
jgi:hypothetical protein